MARKSALVLALMAALAAVDANALGLGDIVVRSGLNQPLEADIPLISAQDVDAEMLRASLASPDAFERAGVERTYFLNGIRFIPATLPDGRKVVRLRTREPVKEPFLNFIVEVNWPSGRLQREYTLLMDPPVFAQDSRPVGVTRATTSGSGFRPAPAGPAPAYTGTYSGDSYGPTGASDTLWGIANKVRGTHSTAQTMVALYQANPDAFSARNINSLKQGQTLKVPSSESIEAVSMAEARRVMVAHNQAWATRSGVADEPSTVLEAGQGGAAAATGVTASGDGQLKLVSPAGGAGKNAAGGKGEGSLRDELSTSKEAQEALTKENEELRSQLGQMSSQVEKMERLVKLKDEQMAALQSGKPMPTDETATSESGTVTTPSATETTGEPAAETPMAEGGNAPAPAAAQTESTDTATTPTAETTPAPVTAAPAAATMKAAKPLTSPVVQEESFLDQVLGNPLWMALGGGAVIVLLLGGLLLMRRRQSEDESFKLEPVAAPLNFKSNETETTSLSDDLDIPDVEPELASALEETPVQAAPQSFDHIADPLGEADIYIAYGKYGQAEELLKATLAKDPARHEARVKLLECYAESRDRNAFEGEALKLREAAEFDDTLRGRIADLFESAWHGERFSLFGAERAVAAPELPSADDIFASLDVESETRLGGPRPTEPEVPEGEFSLDDELGEKGFAAASPAAEETFEFDLTPGAETAEEEKGLDFNLDGFEMPKAEPAAPAAAEVNVDEPLDFNLDNELAAFDTVATESEPTPAASSFNADTMSELSIDEPLDFDLDAELAGTTAPAESAGLSAEDEELLAGSDEASTKLDLARAYIDMGDHDGARDILNEVLSEGSVEQKQEAEALLSKLG